MSTTAVSEEPGSAPPIRPRARRVWFPIAWPLVLAAVATGLWLSGTDRGISITATHVSVVLALFGLAVWTIRSSGLSRRARLILAMAPCILLDAFYLQLLPVKTLNDGDTGFVGWRWRWAEPDRKLTAAASPAAAPLDWKETPQDYPRFLGNGYWAEVEGVELETDWKNHPPRTLWKQPIGAGWSGFAIVGDYAVTQEQRGEQELVVCYELRTGKVAWSHADNVRWDPGGGGSLGGIGPRATPTVHDGRVFTHGATGILNCLDARTGNLLWSHDTLAKHNVGNVMWGKAGSPLIVDSLVIVSVGGDDASLVAYDIAAGKKAWGAGDRRSSYATPVLTALSGVRQIVTVDEDYVTGHAADDGRVLWEHEWLGSSDTNASASQPVPVGDDRILLSKGYGEGAELIKLKRDDRGFFSVESLWKNRSVMRTKMSNVVVRDGHVYGLSEGLLQCIELDTGKSRWKKRRSPEFGHGQIMLVGDVILAVTEKSGEVVLVEASPRKYRELASLPALEGVTWNNPALSGPYLLVRNAEQAACLELPLRHSATTVAQSP
jgi:outer membrane protein assembly factor BamB